jgi:prophage antirepressor-like protein
VSTEIVPFAFEGVEVRTLMVDGEPRLVVSDLAKVLGYRSAADAARLLRDAHKGYAEVRTLGGPQNMLVTNEKGMYRLMLRSNASNAEAVQDWITDEVLPQIRRTGAYASPAADLALPHDYLTALEALVDRERQNVALATENAALTPRAEAWTAIASAEGDYSVGDAAKMLARAGIATGPQRLFDTLNRLKWTYRDSDGKPRPYAERVEKGYLSEKPQFHYHPGTGERVLDAPQVRVTLKGVERLRQRLGGTTVALRAVNS